MRMAPLHDLLAPSVCSQQEQIIGGEAAVCESFTPGSYFLPSMQENWCLTVASQDWEPKA